MNTKQLVAYLESAFKDKSKGVQREILSKLQLMMNDSGTFCSGQELVIKQAIDQASREKCRSIDRMIFLLSLAAYINSCHSDRVA